MKSRNHHAQTSVGTGSPRDEVASVDPSDRETVDSLYNSSKWAISEGEQALMLAILENAINDFQKYFLARKPNQKRQYQEAVAWISGKNSDCLFSFENICANVGISPTYLRRCLRAWAECHAHTPAHAKAVSFPPGKLLRRRSLR